MKEDELLVRHHSDQDVDETQTQTAEEGEPMTGHFAVNCKLHSVFSRSHEYQKNISHRLNASYEPPI